MARALELAARGLNTTDPNPRVGCVLVRGGETLGEGWHERAGEAHAEVAALKAARGDVRGATAYVSLEPCSHTGRTPPCADALDRRRHWPGGMRLGRPQPAGRRRRHRAPEGRRHLGLCRNSRERGARPQPRFLFALRARPSVCAAEARDELGWAHCARRRRAIWISGEAARADVQRWRARSSAVLTGAGTVRSDDPRLDVRWVYGPWVRQPLRVVLDADSGLPARCQDLRARGRAGVRIRGGAARGRGAARGTPAPRRRGASAGDRPRARSRRPCSRDWPASR